VRELFDEPVMKCSESVVNVKQVIGDSGEEDLPIMIGRILGDIVIVVVAAEFDEKQNKR